MTVQELEHCIDTYGSEIYSFCKQMTGSVQEGEELYQDTFMKAMELAAKVDMNNNPKSYLLSIAIRLWKNKKRKVAWRRRIAGEDSLDDENGILEEASNRPQEDRSLSPEDAFLHQEQQDMLRNCIAQLPDKYRMLLYLYYTAEMSVGEISQCIKIPQGTVKSRLYQAREMLRERLEVAGYDR